jgi:hypothetical protein
MRTPAFVATLLLMSAIGAFAHAAADRAELLIREGVELRKKGKNADALTRFQSAYEMAHTPRAAAQLGLCEAALERWVEADTHLTESLLSSDPWIERNRTVLESTATNVRGHLVTVKVAGGPAGASVRVNGEAIGRLPTVTPIRVLPGQIVATATLTGFDEQRIAKPGNPGETVSFDFQLRAAPAATATPAPAVASPNPSTTPAEPAARPAPAPDGEAHGSWLRPAAYVSGGLAAAALALGIVSHVQRQAAASDFPSHGCNKDANGMVTGGMGSECQDIADRFDASKTRMIVGYAAAGALGAAALTLWLLDRPTGSEQAAATSCGPMLATLGASCRWTF